MVSTGSLSWLCNHNNISRNTNLVVESHIRQSHLHKPLKHGHLQVEVLGKFINCGTWSQLRGRKPLIYHVLWTFQYKFCFVSSRLDHRQSCTCFFPVFPFLIPEVVKFKCIVFLTLLVLFCAFDSQISSVCSMSIKWNGCSPPDMPKVIRPLGVNC